MAGIRWLETDTLSNQNISSPLAIGAYTANADRAIMCQAFVDQVAGSGDYVMYCTLQINGAGSIYVILPKTTMTAAAGEFSIAGQSGWVNVRSGDIVTVYVDGLIGDTTTPDTIVRWFEDAALQPTTADLTLDVSATGEAGLDFNNIKAATAPTTLTNITVPTVTTVGSATLANTQGAITWAQQKIVANVANEGALDIRNSNAAGHGTLNDGGNVGLYNSGASTGQYNFGTADYGIQAGGGTADIFGDLTGNVIGDLDGTIDGLTADALADFFDTDSGETSATAIDGSVVKEIMDGLCTPTVFPAGAINFTYTVTDSVTTLPIEGVEVWISTDNPAVNIVWKGDTDAFGVARDVNGDLPALDVGTYYFWRQKAGYTFTDPDSEVVS